MLPPRIMTRLFLIFVLTGSQLPADDSLSSRIDSLVQSHSVGPLAVIASDAEFLRRVTLDLHGMIPTSADARAFLDDASPNKRKALIDRLLTSPRYAIHMANVFDVMMMERRPDKHVTTVEWQKYLQSAFEKNLPFDRLAREILSADGVDPNLRPAAKFFLDRDAEPNIMARDIGRIFFGMDLQCAQCHDHPIVDHYLQTDYHGLLAFVNRTVIFTDEAAKKSFLAEKADGETSYKSVFTQDSGQIRPRLPGENEIDEPRFRQGEDYVTHPLPGVRLVPKYSRRSKMAELASNGSNRQFNTNIANRIWAHMMGRGLVHPVDLHHPLNPPAHPAVLELITNEFIAMKYDLRAFLRQLAMTSTYQRSFEAPTEITTSLGRAAEQIASLTTEHAALKAAADESQKLFEAAQTELKAASTALAPVEAAWRTTETAVTAAKKPVDEALIAVAKSQKAAADKQKAINAFIEAVAKSTEAAKLLPNDKDVAAAVATLTTKQTQLTGELTALQKTITDQTAAVVPLQAKLVEAYVPADAAYAAYLEARKPVDAAKAKLIAAWNKSKSDSLAVTIRTKNLEADEAYGAYQASVSGVALTRAESETRKTELAASVTAVEQQQAEMTKMTIAVAENEKAAAAASKLLEDTKVALAEKQSVAQSVADACAKTELALQKLPADTELTAIVQKLKDRLEPLSKEVAQIGQTMAAREVAMKEAATSLASAKQMLALATNELTVRQQNVSAKTTAFDQAVKAVRAAESDVATGQEKLVELWTIGAGVRPLKQLSPEQLGWSLMQATGVIDPHRPAADAEIEKTVPKATVANDPALARTRELKVEQQLNEIMRGNVSQFVGLYGASAGQPQDDFFATPDQALFVANGGTVIGWSASGQLAQRLAPLTDAKTFADELYLSTLTRRPTDVEINEVSQYLASRPSERPNAIRELVWSLVTSVEFRFNH